MANTITTQAQISLKKLLNLSNPLKDGWHKTVNADEVASALHGNDIFPSSISEDMHRDEFIKLVAYYHANPAQSLPELNLGDMKDIPISWKDMHAMAQVAAVILKTSDKSTEITLDVTGEKEVVESLFKVLPQVSVVSDIENIENNDHSDFLEIDWDANDSLLYNTWDNEDYVTGVAKNPTSDFFSKISERLRNSDEFIKGLFKINPKIVQSFPDEIFYSPLFLDISKENNNLLFNYWDTKFSGLFIDKSNIWTPKVNNPSFKKRLINFINKPDNLETLLTHREAYKIVHHIKDETRVNPDVAMALLAILNNAHESSTYISSDINAKTILPQSWFEKDENSIAFMKNLSPKISLYYEYDFIWKNWVGNKEKLLEYLPEIKPEHIKSVLDDVPSDLMNDKEVLHTILKIEPSWYAKLPDALKKDAEVVQIMIDYSKYYFHIEQLPNAIIFGMEDKENIQKMLQIKPDLIVHKSCPASWREDVDNLMIIANRISNLSLNSKVWKKLSEPDNAKRLMAANPECYPHLTQEARENPEFACQYLRKNRHATFIPKNLWSSQDFCIKAMKYLQHPDELSFYKENIPQNFWNRQSFVLEVCKKIDNLEISYEVLKVAPIKISQILETFDAKEGEYHKLIKDYFWKVNLQNKYAIAPLPQDMEDEPVVSGKMKI